MSHQWYVVVNDQGGCVSLGTVVADPLPGGLSAVALSDADAAALNGGGGVWDAATQSVIVPPPPVPDAVEARKLRRWLILNGHDPDGITAAIGAMVDPVQRALTRNEWEYSTSYTRRHPMFDAFVRVTRMTVEQIDAAFREASEYQ
jgi:hypothetical protein